MFHCNRPSPDLHCGNGNCLIDPSKSWCWPQTFANICMPLNKMIFTYCDYFLDLCDTSPVCKDVHTLWFFSWSLGHATSRLSLRSSQDHVCNCKIHKCSKDVISLLMFIPTDVMVLKDILDQASGHRKSKLYSIDILYEYMSLLSSTKHEHNKIADINNLESSLRLLLIRVLMKAYE